MGRKQTEETKRKIGEKATGREHTEETKEKISMVQKGVKRGPYKQRKRFFRNCATCGEPVALRPCEEKKLNDRGIKNIFCPGKNGKKSDCYLSWANRKKIDVPCSYCGEILKISKNKINETNFCKDENGKLFSDCRTLWLKENSKVVSIPCANCGKPVERCPGNICESGNVFCNRSCHDEHMKTKIEVECACCGKTLMRWPSKVDRQENQFCNNICNAIWLSINIRGENHPNWQDGRSEWTYCEVWRDEEYKRSFRDRDKNRCMNPKCWGKSKKLVIHHIDHDRMNCGPSNLITLCASCNKRADGSKRKRKSSKVHEVFYKRIMSTLYGYEYEQQLSLLEAVNQ